MPTAPTDQSAHWQARLRALAEEVGVVGATLGIWRDGEETLASYGVLSTATGVEATPSSLFQIGSITKVWTATMVMQLVDEGRLDVDSPVADVLPGVRLGRDDASADVTVRHLLTHTSGLDGDIWTDTGRGDDCVERYVDLLADAARNYPVGAAYSYCNSGFVVLGRIVEVLDGRSWDASLRARLIGPLGLTETVTLPEQAILHRAAVGHREHPHERDPVSVWGLPRSVAPAGLVTAGVHDVLTFARLHLDGGLTPSGQRQISDESVRAMQELQVAIPSIDERDDAIGLSWRLNRWGDKSVIGHDGGTIGQLAYLRIQPETRLAVCLLTNSSVSAGLYQKLFTEIFQTYGGIAPPSAPQPAAVEPPELARHSGRYERSSRRYDVSLRNGRLHVVSTTTAFREALDAEGPEEFDLHPVDGSGVRFVCRTFDEEPWIPLLFGSFADGTPYLYLSGRATPKLDDHVEDHHAAEADDGDDGLHH